MAQTAPASFTRRSFLAAATASALARPALGGNTRVLRFVPSSNLTYLDPTFNPITITTTHAFMVFDQLYGLDSQLRPQPQMAEGHDVSDDNRTWTIRLRGGLKFHDGEKVLARDAAASILRWSARDSFGQALRNFTDTIDAPDDRTIRIRLKRPMGAVLDALAHSTVAPLMILPERLAKTNPFTPNTEAIGSGPFRFLADEYLTGDHMAYARFDGYVPRDEPPDLTSGGKRAYFDRVEWKIIPDPATAGAALQSGEVDWYELILPDLGPVLGHDRNLTVVDFVPHGLGSVQRFNFAQPPFNIQAVRHVIRDVIVQTNFLQSIVGDTPQDYQQCYSMYLCGLPGVTEFGSDQPPRDLALFRQKLIDAGYRGEKLVILSQSDYSNLYNQGSVLAELLRKLGCTVDLQVMDSTAVTARRASTEGWNIFITAAAALSLVNPAINFFTRGPAKAGWVGSYVSPAAEQAANGWLAATTQADRQHWLAEAQRVAWDEVPVVPLGFYKPKSAHRNSITGLIHSDYSLFWNVRPS